MSIRVTCGEESAVVICDTVEEAAAVGKLLAQGLPRISRSNPSLIRQVLLSEGPLRTQEIIRLVKARYGRDLTEKQISGIFQKAKHSKTNKHKIARIGVGLYTVADKEEK